MEFSCRLICQFCLLQFVLWSVKGTYYVKPAGRYEISEMPLPSSVIEQINKSNGNTPVTPTGVSTHSQTTSTVQPLLPPKPAPCPQPSVCPCPCPQPSSGGQPSGTSLRPLPNNGNNRQPCASFCVCLCFGPVPPQVIPPKPVLPPGPNENATVSLIPVIKPSQTSTSSSSTASPTPPKQSTGTLVSCTSSSAAKATPMIFSTVATTCSSTLQQSNSSITRPQITVAVGTPAPASVPPSKPTLVPVAVMIPASPSSKPTSSAVAILPLVNAIFPGSAAALGSTTRQAPPPVIAPAKVPAVVPVPGDVTAASQPVKY